MWLRQLFGMHCEIPGFMVETSASSRLLSEIAVKVALLEGREKRSSSFSIVEID